jgi:hypothetical protein
MANRDQDEKVPILFAWRRLSSWRQALRGWLPSLVEPAAFGCREND